MLEGSLKAFPSRIQFGEVPIGGQRLEEVLIESECMWKKNLRSEIPGTTSLREKCSLSLFSEFELVNAIRDVDPESPLRLRFVFRPRSAGSFRSIFKLIGDADNSEVFVEMTGVGV